MTIDEQEIARLDAFAQWCKEKADDPAFTPQQSLLWNYTGNVARRTAKSFRRINEWQKEEHVA